MLKPLLKNLVYRTCYLAQYQKHLLNRIKQHGLVVVLSLHRVSPKTDGAWPPLAPNVFDSLLCYLKKHFIITTFHELENLQTAKPKLILSFDDGYYDFLEYAMPILKKHAVKANQNIIPSQLLNQKPLWNIALYDFINAAPESLLKNLRIPGLPDHLLKGKVSKIRVGLEISHILKKLPVIERDLIINDLEETLFTKLEPYSKTRMLTLKDMPLLLAEHEIGVHSYSHNSMGQVDMSYFADDFFQCKRFFNEHQFPEMDIYAFPNGSYRNEQLVYLQQQGVKYILLVDDEYATQQSPYPRFNIAASNQYEAIFQGLGIKSQRKISVGV